MKTKDIILATAKEMISEVGFHKSTTANLAKMANISEGTIYRHFESKEDILLHIHTILRLFVRSWTGMSAQWKRS